jgi:hypothetical protein
VLPERLRKIVLKDGMCPETATWIFVGCLYQNFTNGFIMLGMKTILLALERDLEDFTPVFLLMPYAGVRAGYCLYYKSSLVSIQNI